MIAQLITAVLVGAGAGFIVLGTVGLFRLPDALCRLHALTKADNLGLGLICGGLAVSSDSGLEAVRLLLIWVLAVVSSASISTLVASSIWRGAAKPSSEDRR